MTADQFEKLASIMSGVADDIDQRLDVMQASIDQSFGLMHDRIEKLELRVDTIATVQATMLRMIANLEGFAPEIIDHGHRLFRIEQRLDLPRPALK